MDTLAKPLGPCARAGCDAAAEFHCEYLDRRGQECSTVWCSIHAVQVWEWRYCQRHGGVYNAVFQGSLLPAPLPDITDRSASLALWVSARMEDGLLDLLRPHQQSAAQLVRSPVQLAFVGPERSRHWRKRWLVASTTGADHALSVGVLEADPTRVTLDIDGERIGASVPPWLSDRAVRADDSPQAAIYYQRLTQRLDARLRLLPQLGASARPGETGHYTVAGGAR